ncbi:GspG family T2SS major pseudopilin variant XcpT [soil metagenome]
MLNKLIAILNRRRATRTSQRGHQRGMTLLEIMIVLAILALVMGLVVGPRVMKMFGESKVHIAQMTVVKYANEAYPSWSQSHSDKSCPAQLTDLNEYMNNKDVKDPWGNDYKMYCGQNLPNGAKGLAVISNGEDGKEGTTDDVKSW